MQLSAIISPIDASFPEITWGLDLGSGYATINQTGLLNAYQPGIVRVTATAKNGVNAILTVYVTSSTLPTTKLQNGTREYLTANFNGDIWMVENSMEGTSAAVCYDGDAELVNGYYYTKPIAALPSTDPNAPCQSGWHEPTNAEAAALTQYLQTDGMLSGAADYWSGTSNWAGFYYPKSTSWLNWQTQGLWWCHATSSQNDAIGSYTNIVNMFNPSNDRYASVRCVQDKHEESK